jgi:hypothetical protein
MRSIAEVEVGVGVPRAQAFVTPPPDRPSADHPPRKKEKRSELNYSVTGLSEMSQSLPLKIEIKSVFMGV